MASGEWKQTWRDNWSDGYQPGDLLSSLFNRNKKQRAEQEADAIQQQIDAIDQQAGELTQAFQEDREHTEMREDTEVQRRVDDMLKAGINPYTIGASGGSAGGVSSPSKSGEGSVQTKLSMLGYIMDLKNLDAKNRQISNGLIGSVLKAIGNAVGK